MVFNMNKVNEFQDKRWNFYSLALIFFLSIIILFKWPLSPSFIDIYYHLSVVKGFNDAAGFVTTDFWEFAPFGRPHLYPPLLHFLMLLFYKCGFTLLSVARLFEFIIYPALLIVIWKLTKDFFGERLAFFTVLIAISCYSFYLSVINFMPASLATILGLLAFYYFEKEKLLASTIFLALCFYAHAAVPWIFMFSFIIYGLTSNSRFKKILKVIILSIILSLPILIYQYLLRRYADFSNNPERFILEINLWLYLAAIPAIVISFKKKGKHFFILSLLVAGLMPLFFGYRYRYLSGQGTLPLIFLSALSLEMIYLKSSKYPSIVFKNLNRKFSEMIILLVILVFFLIFSPALLFQNSKVNFLALNATYVNLVPQFRKINRPNEFSIYFYKYFHELEEIVQNNSSSEDIIYCNKEYTAGLLSVFSGRATSTGMLKEIMPFKKADPINAAKLIIWIKEPNEAFNNNLAAIVKKHRLEEIKETEIAYIYKNQNPDAKRIVSKPALPTSLVFGLLFLLLSAALFDISRK